MTLPRRKEKPRSGIARAVKREWPRHRAWVRSHECCAKSDAHPCEGPIQAAHVRTGTDGGTGQKPSDWWLISLCMVHHGLQHAMGEAIFEKAFKLDMKKLAAEFAARSPDLKMREAMRNG